MRATEMHDLLLDARNALRKQPLFKAGSGAFAHISYCVHCGYSSDWITRHGHDKKCVLDRLERATGSDGESL